MSENKYIFREAKENEWDECMNLAWRTFLKFEADTYTSEGIENFHNFVTDQTLKKMFFSGTYKLYVATEADKIIGMISLREVTHISLLFVDEKYHKQGIARELIRLLREEVYKTHGPVYITVNAAPYAYGFYHKVGFIDKGIEKTKDGITYTPMELIF